MKPKDYRTAIQFAVVFLLVVIGLADLLDAKVVRAVGILAASVLYLSWLVVEFINWLRK